MIESQMAIYYTCDALYVCRSHYFNSYVGNYAGSRESFETSVFTQVSDAQCAVSNETALLAIVLKICHMTLHLCNVSNVARMFQCFATYQQTGFADIHEMLDRKSVV